MSRSRPRRPVSVAILVCVAALALSATQLRAEAIYSTYTDYSTTNNPNGVWEYGYASAASGPVTPFTTFVPQSYPPGVPARGVAQATGVM